MGIKKALLQTIAVSALTLTAALPLPAPAQDSVGGNITDSRDGQRYRTVKIGKNTWMAENLNYETGGSYCYGDSDSNCAKYGRLYTWEAAIKVCQGLGGRWRLPTRGEWDNLVNHAGGANVASKKLKSKCGWDRCDGYGKCVKDGNGTDDYGFSALPGGIRDRSIGVFDDAGNVGRWWSASEARAGYDPAYAKKMFYDFVSASNVYYGNDDVVWHSNDKRFGFSVRCVKD